MGVDGIGSSVIIALAALMWFLYLIPTWFKRQEYLATERNAVRLQQTMRILAESAELPSVVRVEATARTVAAQQRALKQQQRHAASKTSLARPMASLSDQAQRTMDSGAQTRRRLRRSRALASLVLLISLLAAGFGVPAALGGNWLLLAVSIAVGAGSVALLGQAATVTRAREELRRVSITSATPGVIHDQADYREAPRTGWTPIPLPKPRYLSDQAPAPRSAVAHVSAQQARLSTEEFDHAAALRAASAEAERALRDAQESPDIAHIGRASAVPEAPVERSRFASMGVIDPNASNAADLDEILRRRRAVG